jgi:uncharacterized protein YqhQ
LATLRGEPVVGVFERMTGTRSVVNATRKPDGSIDLVFMSRTKVTLSRTVSPFKGETQFVTASDFLVPLDEVKLVS